MPFTWETGYYRTVFIIASNFKNIAIFKPKFFRGNVVDVYIVWYSETDKGLLRVSGNVHKYSATVRKGSIDIKNNSRE